MSNSAVILAGGKGTRLRPYTILIPKPLVPVGDVPILEIVIKKLQREGFENITITVNHLAELIQAFFSDGKKWNVSINYSLETEPLSTMGPLKLIKNLPENFLILNGDVLTDLDLNKLFESHKKNKNLFTIAVHKRIEKIDYGVMELDNQEDLISFKEKPEVLFDVSMGIYAANKRILDFIPENKFFGFDHLMHTLLEKGHRINTYRHEGTWLDIGRPADYEKAIQEFNSNNL